MTALIENTDSTFERPWYLKSRKLTNYHKNIVMPKNIGRGTSEILFPVVPKNNKFGWILKPFAFFWDEARDARSFVKGVSSINIFFRPRTFSLLKNRPTKEKQNIFPRVNSAYIIKYIAIYSKIVRHAMGYEAMSARQSIKIRTSRLPLLTLSSWNKSYAGFIPLLNSQRQ